jgi:neutral trehalase
MVTGKLNKIATVASFFPLAAHAASYQQFLRLREHAVNSKEFNTVFPFPTVSHADPTFEKDMWRGPVWINTSFLAIRGIKEYGDQALVRYFSQHLVDSVYQVWTRTGTFYEFYDPDRYDFVQVTRKKGLGPLGLSGSHNPIEVVKHLLFKQIILGKKPVDHFMGWTGLVNTLAIEELGFDPTK